MNFRIVIGLLLCLSCAESEESTRDKPEFPSLRDYIKRRGDSDGSEHDLTEFLNNHYIRLRLPRSKKPEMTKGKWKNLRKLFVFGFVILLKIKTILVVSVFALLALVGLTLTKGFAVVIHQDNYEYHPLGFNESWLGTNKKKKEHRLQLRAATKPSTTKVNLSQVTQPKMSPRVGT